MVTILNYNGKQLADWRAGRTAIDDLDPGTQTVIAQLRQMLGLPEDYAPPLSEAEPEHEHEPKPTTDLRASLEQHLGA